jgi:hypothetical protein
VPSDIVLPLTQLFTAWKTLLPKLEDILHKFKIQREDCARKIRQSRRKVELANHLSPLLQEREDMSMQLCMNLQDAFALPAARLLITDDDGRQGISAEKWEAKKAQIIMEMDDFAGGFIIYTCMNRLNRVFFPSMHDVHEKFKAENG